VGRNLLLGNSRESNSGLGQGRRIEFVGRVLVSISSKSHVFASWFNQRESRQRVYQSMIKTFEDLSG